MGLPFRGVLLTNIMSYGGLDTVRWSGPTDRPTRDSSCVRLGRSLFGPNAHQARGRP
jgi:hypothetical protein